VDKKHMFSKAYKKATEYTKPVIISTRTFDGEVKCGCGAFILINKDGWIITVAHILESFLAFQNHQNEITLYNTEVEKIKSNANLTEKQKRKKINKLNPNRKWITNHSFWWGANEIKINEFKFFYQGDIAIGKIENYKHSDDMEYPKFKNPENIEIGTSLCKLGFPFYEINASFDEHKGFILAENSLPLPFFPIEGMFTRNINLIDELNTSKFKIKFLETSSPGLRGQSGGPIFDREGIIWAVQSRTQHFPLGFSPAVNVNGKETTENQFLNVGWGVHPESISDFLNEHKISFDIAE
jgi:hypothetical protein